MQAAVAGMPQRRAVRLPIPYQELSLPAWAEPLLLADPGQLAVKRDVVKAVAMMAAREHWMVPPRKLLLLSGELKAPELVPVTELKAWLQMLLPFT